MLAVCCVKLCCIRSYLIYIDKNVPMCIESVHMGIYLKAVGLPMVLAAIQLCFK